LKSIDFRFRSQQRKNHHPKIHFFVIELNISGRQKTIFQFFTVAEQAAAIDIEDG
jgi:hypothetical protein